MRTYATAVVMVAGFVASDARAQENNHPPHGFTAIFNGKDLSGWHGMQHNAPRKLAAMSAAERAKLRAAKMDDVRAHWSVEDGELVNDGHGAYLTTNKDYGDIDFWIDYKTVAKADSGIYLRATPQVQIWDYTKEGGKWGNGADKGSGGLYNNRRGAPGREPLVLADKPFGQWNRFHIVQVGARTSVWLNGELVVDHAALENYFDRKKPLFGKGPIELQTHGGEIRWRNVFLHELSADEANAILRKHGNDGFESLSNGKDLSEWAGAVSSYEVKDGAIACKAGKGGVLYTKATYGDFVARMEIKLPEGGNNGLAIRYPGHGDPAYTGMCELQVLDDTAERYANLDPRQYHASAYGMTPAHRGYLRPAGEWNFQEVIVRGSHVQVELNGTKILDTDLSKVTDYMGDRKHPGKDRKSGHFGLAGHGAAVQFRNVRIKRLD